MGILNRSSEIVLSKIINWGLVQSDDDYKYKNKVPTSIEVNDVSVPGNMLSPEYFANYFDIAATHTETSDIHKTILEIKTNSATLIMNASMNTTEPTFAPELFYRHSLSMTVVYCIAYFIVFAVGLVGNFFVIAVVFRSPRMRTVTNFFIVNLAVADILVVVFCLPATLMSNIFVRKLFFRKRRNIFAIKFIALSRVSNEKN
ncbi:hypothetical protein WA026_014531 [Henosepilachna vigintioctopunctata]|uniref:G-protein coupled receptors family 1 profile domain-containing protein n=1 Tax=Henosepilachna vigintioctopunctata TaxID=420089 RepID=A0AAW1UEU4_9CUCU